MDEPGHCETPKVLGSTARARMRSTQRTLSLTHTRELASAPIGCHVVGTRDSLNANDMTSIRADGALGAKKSRKLVMVTTESERTIGKRWEQEGCSEICTKEELVGVVEGRRNCLAPSRQLPLWQPGSGPTQQQSWPALPATEQFERRRRVPLSLAHR